MLVTELGMVMDFKDGQSENANPPIPVTVSGIVTECKDEQS